jgi:hypothetical protein
MPPPPGSTPAQAHLPPQSRPVLSSGAITATVVALLVSGLLAYIALI